MELWKIEGTFRSNMTRNGSYIREHVRYVACFDIYPAIEVWQRSIPEHSRLSTELKKCTLFTDKETKFEYVPDKNAEQTRDIEVLSEVFYNHYSTRTMEWYQLPEEVKQNTRNAVSAVLNYIEGKPT